MAQSFPLGKFGFGHGFEMAAIARNLADHGTFGNPFGIATGPTAVVPPLYPLFLAAMIKIFGDVLPAAQVANIAANALTAAFLPALARAFYSDARPGLFAGALWILAMPVMPQWDVSFTVALETIGCFFIFKTTSRAGRAGCEAAGCGVIAGLTSLLNPVTFLIFGTWAGFRLLSLRAAVKDALRYMSILVVAATLCNVPWLVRNYRIWHAPVLRTNFGMTVYSSNNDCAQSSLFKDGANGCYQTTHPIASESEARLLQKMGEIEYDRRRTADAWNWIRSHGARFRQLTLERMVEFWFPDPTPAPRQVYAVWAITLLSIPGIALMARTRSRGLWFVLLVWLAYPLVYYIAVSADRYRYPILWTSLLPAGYSLAAVWPADRLLTWFRCFQAQVKPLRISPGYGANSDARQPDANRTQGF